MITKNKLLTYAVFLGLGIFTKSQVIAQIPVQGQIDEKINRNIQSLYQFLKTRATDTTLTEKDFIKTSGSMYDTATDIFFDKILTDKIFREKEYGDIRFQHQVLYTIDKAIDYVPVDSMYLIAADFKNGNSPKNHYIAGYLINGKRFAMVEIKTDESGRFIFIIPYIYFDQSEGQQIQDFILRNKNTPKRSR